jgi:N,N'-diacetyllegionaminate synthase
MQQLIRPLKIGRKLVGPGYPSYLIFEVASTHENSWKIAKEYVEQAKEAGADALKFQLFTADGLLNPLATYLTKTYNYFQTAETPRNWFPKLLDLCNKANLDLLCTPFDEDGATYLNSLNLPAVKIASGDLTNHSLIKHVAKFKKPIILSTGMGTMKEVVDAMKVLSNSKVALLHCTSVYPMPYEDANLRAMVTLQEKFNAVVGYSDNGSKGILVPLLAISLGASIIEKHVTSQKERGNLDDVFSLSIDEFKQMAGKIRQLEKDYGTAMHQALKDLKKQYGAKVNTILGSSVKKPGEYGLRDNKGKILMSDVDESHWARRGVYFKEDIVKGTKITDDMLVLNRPDVGVSGPNYQKVIGSIAKEDIPAKHPIKLEGKYVRMFHKSDIKKTYKKESEKHFVHVLSETALFN